MLTRHVTRRRMKNVVMRKMDEPSTVHPWTPVQNSPVARRKSQDSWFTRLGESQTALPIGQCELLVHGVSLVMIL